MDFVTLGLFIFDAQGMEGAIIQMISHGFVSGALFLCVGVLYDRIHSREISSYGGVVNTMPVFATFFVFFLILVGIRWCTGRGKLAKSSVF